MGPLSRGGVEPVPRRRDHALDAIGLGGRLRGAEHLAPRLGEAGQQQRPLGPAVGRRRPGVVLAEVEDGGRVAQLPVDPQALLEQRDRAGVLRPEWIDALAEMAANATS